ncbi:glutamate--cysteine ligase [Methylococcaceae bacterium CS1]|nr:glutamate--cysteine ligase [Methyloprofundus sp.]TXK94360.1 glutamate--cysteine ligase [Methylococcaceae bacterium CS5]TXK94980.1 glutamate--cysteine ligase [Methylococcaceae bacterium CS4]TXL03458.1 glutamate--cysteine ligase [Methylococcaceae bacterium CS3]TXL04113.1 glutamate--cysteine ligase [Methylococcaceae bacterium CS1]TXL10106.1 glutamate--cysteine ligase [Methylococcaceae bacterium CS2]
MNSSNRLQILIEHKQQSLLKNGLKGIEKESLRISDLGFIAQTEHPKQLGAALTHLHITTDYSEALLEFITPPYAHIDQTLDFMHNIHQYVYDQLDDEHLLATSMPCGINGDLSIPIAKYGKSNIGKMKHIYRKGLWHRYGRTMQAIAGIHFNYSVPEALWPVLHQLENSQDSLDDYKSSAYFDLIRNFQRQGWLILYLFGASPAICKNFFKSRPELMAQFKEFDNGTLYHPYATSLRMSDIGYKSNNQADLNIDYNSLNGYVDSLSLAINTPYPDYETIGVKVDDDYQQLNANILQIENEYYSTVRPKQIIQPCEKPTLALKRRGVRYVEIRSLDLDIFNPIGIDANRARFIEALLLSCLVQESPPIDADDFSTHNSNQLKVAHSGRKPGLTLIKNQQAISLKDWANEILDSMQPICDILDANETDNHYNQVLQEQRKLIEKPDLTPSARILAEMRTSNQPFACFADNISRTHAENFTVQTLNSSETKKFNQMAADSHAQQTEIENNDTLEFDDFLHKYFSQQ